MSNHRYFEDQLPFYVAENLAADEQVILEAHLTTCAVCRTNLDYWQTLAASVQLRANTRVNQLPLLNLQSLPMPLPQVNGNYAVPVHTQPTSIISDHRENTLGHRAIVKPQWLTLSAAVVALMMLGALISLSYLPQSLSLVQEDVPPSFEDLVPITVDNAAHLTEIEHLGNGMVNDVDWSPDGKTMAVAGAAGVWLFNPARPELDPNLLPVKDDQLYVLSFSRDGRWLASGGLNGTIYIWDAKTFAQMTSIQPSAVHILALDFSPDGTFLASSGGEWDSSDDSIEIWDVATREKHFSLNDNNGQIRNVAFSPDGKLLASAGGIYFATSNEKTSFSVNLWDMQTGEKVATVQQTADAYIDGLAFSPDGSILAAHEKTSVVLWDVKQLDELRTIKTPGTMDNFNLAFSPDGTQIAAGRVQYLSQAPSINILVYDVKTGDLLQTLHIPNYGSWFSEISGLAYSPDGKTIAAVVKSDLYLLDPQTGASIPIKRDFDPAIVDMSLSDNAKVAISNLDGQVIFWDIDAQEKLNIQYTNHNQFGSLALSHDGKLLALAGGIDGLSHSVSITKFVTGERTQEFQLKNGAYPGANDLLFTPDYNLLITFGYATPPQLWNIKTGQESPVKLQLEIDDVFPSNANYSDRLIDSNGTLLASLMNNHSVGLWNIHTGEKVGNFVGHTEDLSAIALSQDGRVIASASADNTIRIWDVETGSSTYTLYEYARLLLLSPDGTILVSVNGQNMHIWDTGTGLKLATFTTQWINTVLFSSDGRYIVTAGGDGIVRVWGV